MKEGTRQLREIKWIVTECHQQLYARKLDNLEEMDKFPETPCREITISQNGGGQVLSPHVLSHPTLFTKSVNNDFAWL